MSSKSPFAELTELPFSAFAAPSPFAAADPAAVPADAPEGSYTYALVQSAPSVPSEECEVAAAAVEIVIRWGATTLHVAHLAPPRAFHVGEASGKVPVDFELPADRLGAARLPVLRLAADGSPRVVLPAGAKGTATVSGQVVTLTDLAAGAHSASPAGVEPSAEVAGALELPLRDSTRVRFEIGGIELEIASVQAGRKVTGRLALDRRGLPFQALSAALHVGLLAAAAAFMPPSALASEDSLSRERMDDLRMILSTVAEREPDTAKDPPAQGADGPSDNHPGHAGPGDAGKVGSTTSKSRDGRAGIAGPADNASVQLSKAETLAMARSFGMIGVLSSMQDGSASPPSPWGDVALGRDPRSANGALFGDNIAESSGSGGLTLSGVGEGGDSDGRGIGVDRNGMFGPGTGLDRFGPGRLTRPPRHKPADLSMRPGDTEVKSRIPSDVIQRVVRMSFGRFRACYENGLRSNPGLAGRVAVRFVIGRDGAVMSASNGGSDLPDAGVVSCVVAGFRSLQFPQGDDASIATVVYPIVFSPAK